jgi:hypothetical protein
MVKTFQKQIKIPSHLSHPNLTTQHAHRIGHINSKWTDSNLELIMLVYNATED